VKEKEVSMRNTVSFSRVLRLFYPALVFFAVLAVWTKTGYGTNTKFSNSPPSPSISSDETRAD
jgi:hypothetical protein